MPNPIFFAIADKMLGIFEKFLDPAQYDIVRMKRLKKAANWAERDFINTNDLLFWIEDNFQLSPTQNKELERMKKIHSKCVYKHQKYD